MKTHEELIEELEALCQRNDLGELVIPDTSYGEDVGDFNSMANCKFLNDIDRLPLDMYCNSDDVCYMAVNERRIADDIGFAMLFDYIDDIHMDGVLDSDLAKELERDAIEEVFFKEFHKILIEKGIFWTSAYDYYMENFHDWKTDHCKVVIPRKTLEKVMDALN